MEEIILKFEPEITRTIPQVTSAAASSLLERDAADKKNVQNEKEKPEVKKIDESQVKELAEKINDHVKLFSTRLEFSYDIEKGRSQIKVLDKDSGRVIRQIPPEEMLSLIDKMEEIAGLIFNEEA